MLTTILRCACPPNLRDWVLEGHLVHFIVEAVGLLDLREANERGTSSRQIKRATYENVAVRLLCSDPHPDRDSVCTFRRANDALLKSSVEQVLTMAVQMRVLKVGQVTLAVDGTKKIRLHSDCSSLGS